MSFDLSLLRGIAVALFFCAGMSAEEITGTLHDRTGAVISGARVMLISADYVKLAETASGERGEFSFAGLNPGLYFVQAKKPMFHLAQQHVSLKHDQPARICMMASVPRGDSVFTITTDRLHGVEPLPANPKPSRPGGKVEGYKVLSGRPPGFPEAAKQRGANGRVVLLATIQTDGTLADIITLESPDPELEKASLDAFGKWRYAPMKLDGVPVTSDTMVIFDFQYR